jgi:predicted methyltransferase
LNKLIIPLAAGVIAAALGSGASAASPPSPAVTAAVSDTARPVDDTKRDADRKPAETLAFTGVKPGDKVMELVPVSGYFTLLFSNVVGPKGHVYAETPQELVKVIPPKAVDALAAGHPNVTSVIAPANAPTAAEPVDIVFTAQNYHDYHDPLFGPADLTMVNKAIYAALKPGGVYLIIDHAAPAGSGLTDTNTLHRIDPATVKSEVEAAGFKLEAQGDFLANPADPKDKLVFDKSIRGHTDQFIFKFRKPK